MIYPTGRAIAAAALGAPLALAAGLYAGGVWPLAAAWGALVGGLVAADAVLGASRRRLAVTIQAPGEISAGGDDGQLEIGLTFARGLFTPRRAELALATNDRLTARPDRGGAQVSERQARLRFRLHAERRGEGRIESLWVRWRGPLGLAFKQRRVDAPEPIPVISDIARAKEEAIRLFSRDAAHGEKIEFDRGEGSEFQSLREFEAGMDQRTIDWKQSARHGQLLSKEYRTERNHPIYLVLDTGRLMCEPLDGAPKIDRALNAALLLGYACLKTGDRVGLFAFDARPRVFSKAAAGVRAFPVLQSVAARVDYSNEETNFALGLTSLSSELDRRALVVVFTDFADSIGAELMMETLARLAKRHQVMFVVFRDQELEDAAQAEPLAPDDVSRAVVAGALLKERQVVLTRLRRMGVEIVEAPLERVGSLLIARYLDLKRRDRL